MPDLKTALKGWNVVLVDDDPDSLEIVGFLLEMHGAAVHTAPNGEQGWELIKRIRPDFIISDLSMPAVTGWELVGKLKGGDRVVSEIPVIALTAHAMEQDRQRAIAAGFHNFIIKPLDPESFVRQVLTLLSVDRPELLAYLNEDDQ